MARDTQASFVKLLADGASVAEFEELGRKLAEDADYDAAEVQQTVVRALEIRELLDVSRQHQRELAALVDTARDLSALIDVDQVLHAICARARRLLNAEAAYVTLNDQQLDATFVRATDGINSPKLKTLRMPFGTGIGGLVAQTMQPVWSNDYLRDERFVHSAYVDSVVIEEGLHAIVGVPLQRGPEVIGVLLAANRTPSQFRDADVDLLASLGAHAAVALANARLFGQTQRALRELHWATEASRRESEIIERSANVHERMARLILEGATMREVADPLIDVLGGFMLIVDMHGRVLAHVGAPIDALDTGAVEAGQLAARDACALRETFDIAMQSGRALSTQRDGSVSPYRFVSPMLARSERLGALVLTREEMSQSDWQLLERASVMMSILILNAKVEADTEDRMRGELLDDLLALPPRDSPSLRRRAAMLDIDLTAEHAVLSAVIEDPSHYRFALVEGRRLAEDAGGLAGEIDGSVVLLLPDARPDDAAVKVSHRLTPVGGRPPTIGAAGPAAGPQALAEAFTAARDVQRVLLSLGARGTVATPASLGVYGMLFVNTQRDQLQTFIEAFLGPVLRCTAGRRDDLLETLEAYFDSGGHMGKTAATLHVHVNTLYQRFERLEALLGPGWRSADRLQLHLAARLYRMRRSLDAKSPSALAQARSGSSA